MVFSALIVELLTGASYRGDPSTDGPPTKSKAQTISFAPSAGQDWRHQQRLGQFFSTVDLGGRPSSNLLPTERKGRFR
jgi:hypothetical protein